jgi:hypothetical protein
MKNRFKLEAITMVVVIALPIVLALISIIVLFVKSYLGL